GPARGHQCRARQEDHRRIRARRGQRRRPRRRGAEGGGGGRRTMIRAPLCGLAFALLPGAASAAPPSDEDFLSAFAVACLDGYRDPAARAAAIDAAGWRPVADAADPMLARMLAIARRSLEQAEEEDGYTGRA